MPLHVSSTCEELDNYWDKYTEMYDQQNVKISKLETPYY